MLVTLINLKYHEKIKKLTNPIQKINSLIKQNKRVAVLISDYYLKKKRAPVPHWIVSYEKKGGKYYFMDSARGLTILTLSQLKKGIELNKKDGFYPVLITCEDKR